MATPSALSIAGSDSGGGAGIQADLKTFSAFGVYGASVVTAITAQNTRAVTAVEPVTEQMVAAQIDAVFTDIEIHAVKIGMLFSAAIVNVVADRLADFVGPVVLDPVMIAKSGDALLDEDAVDALIARLLPRAAVVTPNLPEAARLVGKKQPAETQGLSLLRLGARAALVKGGHADGCVCTDVLVMPEGTCRLQAPRIETRNTHGTGCSLSSAIAAELAKGAPLEAAVRRAHTWLQGAILAAEGLTIGAGHGPVHHFHEVWR